MSFELTYFSVDEVKETKSYAPKGNKGLLFQNIYIFDQHSVQYKRVSYNVLDLIGDIGGVFELFVSLCGILFNSIAEHSFVLSAMKKIFLIKTSEPEAFEFKEDKESAPRRNTTSIQAEAQIRGIQKYLHG